MKLPNNEDQLVEKWEQLATSWLQVAHDRSVDAPDVASKARAYAVVYQDCADDLKANTQ